MDLADDRQAVYNDIRAMFTDPQRMTNTRPISVGEKTMGSTDDGNRVPLPTRARHLLADEDGSFPVSERTPRKIEVLDQATTRLGAAA